MLGLTVEAGAIDLHSVAKRMPPSVPMLSAQDESTCSRAQPALSAKGRWRKSGGVDPPTFNICEDMTRNSQYEFELNSIYEEVTTQSDKVYQTDKLVL